MRVSKFFSALLTLLLIAGAGLYAQTSIISAEDFKALMKNGDDLVIVDANKPSTYQDNHIKGAVNIDHNDLYQEGDISGLIKSPEELAAFFGEKGISENSKVVIYDDGSQKYNSRVYWVLKYLGAQDVTLLHKDMSVWGKVRLPLASTPTTLEPVAFNTNLRPEFFASTAYVKDNLDNSSVVLVDVRTPEEFNGTSKSDGHIPGAINLNYVDLLTDSGAFKPAAEIKAIAEANGITPDKEVIVYCRTSVRGAVAFVAFRDILGYDKVKVYDGAYVEWVASNPVVQ